MEKQNTWTIMERICLGLAIVNALLAALADKKITAAEIIRIFEITLRGLGSDFSIPPGGVLVKYHPQQGSMTLTLSKPVLDALLRRVEWIKNASAK